VDTGRQAIAFSFRDEQSGFYRLLRQMLPYKFRLGAGRAEGFLVNGERLLQ
jgi:hypothetical protein